MTFVAGDEPQYARTFGETVARIGGDAFLFVSIHRHPVRSWWTIRARRGGAVARVALDRDTIKQWVKDDDLDDSAKSVAIFLNDALEYVEREHGITPLDWGDLSPKPSDPRLLAATVARAQLEDQ